MKNKRGFWILLVAAIILEGIACVQYFYSRAAIKRVAESRAITELRSAELEINVVTAKMESAVKMLAMMVEHTLDNPDAVPACSHILLMTLDDVESAGVAFIPDYYPDKGRWYEPCSSRMGRDSIYTRLIGSADHDYFTYEWFNNGLTIDSVWWCEPYLDDAGAGAMVVSCSYPVRDKEGRIVAVACVDLSLGYLSHVSEYLQVYQDSYYSIRSSTGIDIVAQPDTTPGRKYLVFDEEIDATGWHISIIIPEDILYADLNRAGLIITILMLLGLAVLVFILYRSGRNIQNLIVVSNQKERMLNELEIAQTIQKAMLPKVFPPFVDRPDLNVYGMVRPAKEIGGDLYDFYVRHDKLFFCVGDVSGKGVPASLVMATIRSLFRSTTAHEERAHLIVQQMNDTLSEQNDQNMFVTFFVGVLDIKSGKLSYCNAGHNAPVLINNAHATSKEIEVIPNLPVGIMVGYEFEEQEIQLALGDTIFLYTDGLTEAENKNHEQFGEARMMSTLSHLVALRPRQIVDRMDSEIASFVGNAQQSDDLTMMAIRYQVPAIVMRNDIRQIPTLAEWVEGLRIPTELNMPINLALEEAVSNVMLYAYPGQNDGKVFVEFVQTRDEQGEKLVFTISDSGVPFDPTQKPETDITLSAEERAIGGLGIHLVRQLMDEIVYVREDGKNILTLVKKL